MSNLESCAIAFLGDTWMTTLDATSRVHTDFVLSYFPKATIQSPGRRCESQRVPRPRTS